MAIFNVGTKTWTKEKDLTKQWLDDCLKEMAKQNLIFRNEEQFQFCLAWAIQGFFNSYNVLLEELTLNVVFLSGKNRSSYTDILVEKENGEFIAIELKYKTAETTISGIDLLNHGAADLGRFDYLWDINRLERLVYSKPKKLLKENSLIKMANSYRDDKLPIIDYIYGKRIVNKKIVKGFAVFLTNEEKYWTYSKKCSAIKPCIYCGSVSYHDFCIADGDESNNDNIGKGKIQDWGKISGKYIKTVRNTWRGRPLEFIGDYKFNWENYNKLDGVENGVFKYCITEIK